MHWNVSFECLPISSTSLWPRKRRLSALQPSSTASSTAPSTFNTCSCASLQQHCAFDKVDLADCKMAKRAQLQHGSVLLGDFSLEQCRPLTRLQGERDMHVALLERAKGEQHMFGGGSGASLSLSCEVGVPR